MPWYDGPTGDARISRRWRWPGRPRRDRSACRCSGSTGPDPDFRGFSGPRVRRRRAPGRPRAGAALGRRDRGQGASSRGAASGPRAEAGDSITLTLADEVDVSRGDVIAAAAAPPEVADQFEARAAVDGRRTTLIPGRSYLLKTQSKEVRATRHHHQVPRRHRQRCAPGGADAGAERHRRRQPVDDAAPRVRALRGQPHAGRLHPHRPADASRPWAPA